MTVQAECKTLLQELLATLHRSNRLVARAFFLTSKLSAYSVGAGAQAAKEQAADKYVPQYKRQAVQHQGRQPVAAVPVLWPENVKNVVAAKSRIGDFRSGGGVGVGANVKEDATAGVGERAVSAKPRPGLKGTPCLIYGPA